MTTPAIEMPPFLSSHTFGLNYSQQVSPSGVNGYIQTLERSAPYWVATYQTPGLSDDKARQWLNFFDLLDGSTYTFLAYDPRRAMPYAYRGMTTASDPWTQTGQTSPRITASNYTNSTITLDRLQNGAIISIGDYISAQIGGIWYLWRSQTAVASVTGNTATLTVRPRPNISSFAISPIRYRMACCEMKMIGPPQDQDSVDSLPSYQFRGAQYSARVPI